MKMSTSLAMRLLAPLLLLAFAAPREDDLKMRDSDHKSFGRLVGSYFDALSEEKGINEALNKVLSQIESKEKSLRGQKLLASPADWEQIFRLVTEDRLKETMKKKGEPTATKLSGNDIEVNAAYCAPKKNPKGAVPLLLVAIENGQDPVEHLKTAWSEQAMRDGAFLVAIELMSDTQSWGVFGSPSAPGGPYQIMTALSVLQREFPIDFNNRFLAGVGKAYAAVEATATAFPHLFAGVIGLGEVGGSDPANLANFRTLPTLLLSGSEGAKGIESKIQELGFGNCSVMPEAGAAQVWEWMGKTPRVAYPTQISYSPRFDDARVVHWLSLQGFQAKENPHIEAKADKDSNTITIDAEKIAELVVWLNDELVDLEKPVKFVVNGVQHEQTVERNAPSMIQNQYSGGDWGRVFTAFITQDVPPK